MENCIIEYVVSIFNNIPIPAKEHLQIQNIQKIQNNFKTLINTVISIECLIHEIFFIKSVISNIQWC